jgi:hypothetical protein
MYTLNRSSVVVICFDSECLGTGGDGLLVRESALLLTVGGIPGVKVGPTHNDGRLFIPLTNILSRKAGKIAYLTRDDRAGIEAEIKRYGHHHLRSSLERWGYLTRMGEPEKINNVGSLSNVVDHEFDHPGSVAVGYRQKYRLEVGNYRKEFSAVYS